MDNKIRQKCLDANLGFRLGTLLLPADMLLEQPPEWDGLAEAQVTNKVLLALATLALGSGVYDLSTLVPMCAGIGKPLEETENQAVILIVAAVALVSHEAVMPEDLISAVLDYLPPGTIFDNPYRASLLQAQDYLEERGTLVNNVLAGDLELDFFEIDRRNLARCRRNSGLPGALAAVFYVLCARKDSFEEALKLAIPDEGSRFVPAIVGYIAGAQHGLPGIPPQYIKLNEERSR